MKKLRLLSLVGIASIALAHAGWAAGHGGGGGGFGGGGFSGGGGGHFGGGAGSRGGGVGFGRPGFSGGRPSFYYSRGMHFTNSRVGQFRAPVSRSPSFARSDRRITNSTARQARTSGRSAFNGTRNGSRNHIAERHDGNWHRDWDRRHAHFHNGRFFVFIDGFWCGLDDGFFPWDYYPYYAYDYYPYDYYPGDYAETEPYYYDEGVYSDSPMVDPTVSAVQKRLTQLGYYNGPADGIYGPLTRDAVAKYQISKQLDVTGSLSAKTLQSFGLRPTAG